nr:MaoC/PaaZ C-terminal domain-containing protein [Rhodococcus sp. HNM0569]
MAVGDVVELGSHTVSKAELLDFAGAWDPQEFHVEPEAAEKGWFGGLIASGIHSMAVLQRLSVDGWYRDVSVICGRDLRDVRFLRPVRPDDTLTGSIVVDDVVLDDHGRGLVTTTSELRKADGPVVLSVVTDLYVRRRPAEG